MPLIRDGRLVEDHWTTVGDEGEVPPGPAIVPYRRWAAERVTLLCRNEPLGVRLAPDEPPGLLGEDLTRLSLVALEFPTFTDGRAFTQARLLRERYRFRGEIRAVGRPIADQYPFLLRCGFDTVEVPPGASPLPWLAAAGSISVVFQPAADRRKPVPHLRHAAAFSRVSCRPDQPPAKTPPLP